MQTRFITALVAALLLLPNTAAAHKCGMAFAAQNRKQNPAGMAAKRLTFAKNFGYCDASAYYDSVYTRETSHFQIFYTLGEGPHATIPEFIDSLAASLESAYKFHTKTMGMRAPQGLDTTSHYQMPVKKGLYPVEVAEIDFLRDPYAVLASKTCNGCFGVTYPSEEDYHKSAIVIDNDFRYIPVNSTKRDTIENGSQKCPYPIADVSINNAAYGFSYADEWAKGIRVTAFHELFHAEQLQYMDLFSYWTYWIEASATANEEIGAPDINDYIYYISAFINNAGAPLDKIGFGTKNGDYGICLLYLYLYGNVDKSFDREIWEAYEKKPGMTFEVNLKNMLDKRGLAVDSVFQDFATRLAFSGAKAKTVDKKLWIWEDQPLWNSPKTKKFDEGTKFEPDTTLYAFSFYSGGAPVIDNYKGRAAALVFKGDETKIRQIANTGSLDSISTDAFFADSIMWVFSRFDNPKIIPEIVQDSTLRAYPQPWHGKGQLCFTPLPESKEFIEIRSGRGELIMREKYVRTTHCISEGRIKENMKPGVYRFRAGSSGKTQKFLIIY